MFRIRRVTTALWARPVLVAQIFSLVIAPACVHPGALDPRPGVLEYRAPLRVDVAGGQVDVGGGNLALVVEALSIDTLIGELAVGATWNSASGSWRWSFDPRHDGTTFTDTSGAVHDLSGLADGRAIPGTHWVKVDGSRIKTKGGLVHEFDPESHGLRALSWGEGTLLRVVYDVAAIGGELRPVAARQCDALGLCHFVFEIAYDANGCVSRIADRAGRVALFDNDAACRIRVARDPVDVERDRVGTRFEYAFGALVARTDSEGGRTAYDCFEGRVVAVRRIGGSGTRVTRFEYGANPATGLYFTRVRDERGGDSLYRYDGEGRSYTRRDAVGDETTYAWSGLRPSAWVDAAGAVTSWSHQDDDPVSMTLATGNTIQFEYAPDAHDPDRPFQRPLLRATDALGVIESRVYDAVGRLERTTNGAGETTTRAYGAEGLLMMIGTPDGGITWFEDHGEHGHPGRAIRQGYTDYRAYDAVGNLIEGADIRDPLSPGRPGIGRLVFDGNRRVVAVELAGVDSLTTGIYGSVSTWILAIERRSDGRILRVTRPHGGDAEMVHDDFGDLVERRERVDGAWRATRYERDAAGDVAAIEWANGMRREYERDAVGRVVETRLVRHGTLEQRMTDTIVQGRLVARLDTVHGAPEQHFHDAAGRIVRIVHPGGEVRDFVYDLRSREIARQYRPSEGAPPLRVVERSWDGADREIAWRDQGEEVWARDWSQGRVDAIRYGNGLVRTFDYDADFSLLLGTRLAFPGADEFVADTRITWSPCGPDSLCVTTRTEVPALAGGPEGLRSYEGHRLGPIPTSASPGGSPGARLLTYQPNDIPSDLASGQPAYHYDALGNWLGVTEADVPLREFVFNAEHNRLLASHGDETHVYTWDAAGFIAERDGVPFTFSPNGRPTAIGDDVAFAWDVLGRPVSSTIDGVTTHMRFGGDVVADAAGAPLRLDLGEVVIDLAADRRSYRHFDFRGNVQLVSDDAGVAVLHRSYSPFAVAERFGDHPDDRSFAGGVEIGDIMLLGARLYDPAAGRFLSPDPIVQVVNAFAYTLGNPVFLWDPSGRASEPTSMGMTAEQLRDAAGFVGKLGNALVAAGVGSGNFVMAGVGGLLILLSIAIRFVAQKVDARTLGGPYRVTIEDVPDGVESGTAPGSVNGHDAGESACSPTAITASAGGGWPSLAIVAFQLLAVWGLAAFIRRRRGAG